MVEIVVVGEPTRVWIKTTFLLETLGKQRHLSVSVCLSAKCHVAKERYKEQRVRIKWLVQQNTIRYPVKGLVLYCCCCSVQRDLCFAAEECFFLLAVTSLLHLTSSSHQSREHSGQQG